MRVDKYIKACCLVKHRSEAKKACDLGVVKINGQSVKASREVRPGDVLTVDSESRLLELEILEVPSSQVSKKQAKDLYRTIHDEHKRLMDF